MVEKKSASLHTSEDNSSGVVSVVMGIQSILFALILPFMGIVFAIIGFFFASNQSKKQNKGWAKIGIRLSIIGIVLSIALMILAVIIAPYIEPYLSQYQAQYAAG